MTTKFSEQYDIIESYKISIIKNLNEMIGYSFSDPNHIQQILNNALNNFIKTYDLCQFNNDYEPIKLAFKKHLDKIKSKTLKNVELCSYNGLIIKDLQVISNQLQMIHNQQIKYIPLGFNSNTFDLIHN